MKKEKEFYYVRESFIQSLFADCVSFGFLFGGLLLNRYVLNNSWYIYVFFMILFFISVSAKANARLKKFYTKEDLIKHLESIEN